MKKFISKFKWFLLGISLLISGTVFAVSQPSFTPSLLPLQTDTYYLGSTSPNLEWNGLYVKNINISGTCTGCGSGGGSGAGTFSTTTSLVPGELLNYSNNTTDIVNIGSKTATSTAKFYFDPNIPFSFLSGITQLNGGFLSNASSTFSSSVFLPSLSQGNLYLGSAGLVQTSATSSLAGGGPITVSNSPAIIGASTATLGCTSATASVTGCLLASDFSKFNSATTTFSTGLTYTLGTNAVTVNTSQNIATLSNLTTNGFITTSGGVGTLGVQAFPISVAQGGTNSTLFSPNSIITSDSIGTTLIATGTQLTVGNLLATSTATSTIVTALRLGNTASTKDTMFNIDCTGRTFPASVSVGGCVNIDGGTTNLGPGLEVIGNRGAGATGRMVVFNQLSTTDVQDMILASSSGANVTNLNLKGDPTGKGILKIESTGSGTGFSNASMISLDGGNETDTQGIFMDWTGQATTGKLLNLRNHTTEYLTLTGAGNLGISSSTPGSVLSIGASGTGINFLDNGTSTFSGKGINLLNGGCYAISGVCITGSGGGSGTVTSVAETVPVGFSISGSPITTSGTLGILANLSPMGIVTVNSAGTGFVATTSQLTVGNILATTTSFNIFTGFTGFGTTTPFGRLSVNPIAGDTGPAFVIGSSTATDFSVTPFGTGDMLDVATSTSNLVYALSVAQGGFGTTTVTGLAIAKAMATSTSNVGFNLSGGCFAIAGTCISGSGGSGTVTSVTLATPSATLTLGGTNPVTTSGTINADLNLGHTNTWTILQNFNYSSSTIYSSFLTSSSTFVNAGTLTIATSSAGCAAFMATGVLTSTGTACGSGGGGSPAGSGTELQYRNGASFGAVTNSAFNSTAGFIGFATTTPQFLLTLATTTRAQLSLQGGTTDNPWNFRSIGGAFYLATSSPTTFATSSNPRLVIDTNGNMGIGTVAPSRMFSVVGTGGYFGDNNTDNTSAAGFGGNNPILGVSKDTSSIGDNLFCVGTSAAGRQVCFADRTLTTFNYGLDGGGVRLGTAGNYLITSSQSSINSILMYDSPNNLTVNSYNNIVLAPGAGPVGGVGISSTTPWATLAVNPTAGLASNQFVVGSSTATNFKIDNSGHVFAPNTSSSGSSQTGYWCYDTNGQLIRDTTVCLVSALKFKKDVQPLTVGLTDLLKLRPVSYFYKDPAFGENQQMGFIADEVASSSPQLNTMLVGYDTQGAVHSFNYMQFTALITKAIQDFYGQFQKIVARVSGLEQRVNEQQKEIDDLQMQINQLKK